MSSHIPRTRPSLKERRSDTIPSEKRGEAGTDRAGEPRSESARRARCRGPGSPLHFTGKEGPGLRKRRPAAGGQRAHLGNRVSLPSAASKRRPLSGRGWFRGVSRGVPPPAGACAPPSVLGKALERTCRSLSETKRQRNGDKAPGVSREKAGQQPTSPQRGDSRRHL